MPDEVKLEPCAELVEVLKWAGRFNSPDEPGFRRVCFVLPEEMAWPEGKNSFHVFDSILAAIAVVNELVEALTPFGEAADDLDDAHEDRSNIWEAPAAMSITAGHLRGARNAIARAAIEATRPTAATDDVVKDLERLTAINRNRHREIYGTTEPPCLEAVVESYWEAHEDAKELGYPSITEALEAAPRVGCKLHGVEFISPGICPFCDEEARTGVTLNG